MTKKLEDLLNLPESKEIIDKDKKQKQVQPQKATIKELEEFDKITAALPRGKGLGDLGDTELDEVS